MQRDNWSDGSLAQDYPVRRAIFSVPGLDSKSDLDLDTVLTGASGVAGVKTDGETHIVAVDYDPDFVSQESLERAITGAGYRIDSRHQ